MNKTLKLLISLILPITVSIIVPLLIEKDISVKYISALMAGLPIIFVGLCVMIMSISDFARIGKGTLAPWSPTKKLVITGIYRYVRNPMIIGLVTVLIGESITILSLHIFIWAVIFFVVHNIFIFVYEEPNLKKKFGEEYTTYKNNVPRWIPRIEK
jgi:protein-S-isoprenylcysteine O-methyltransferase Ste14